MPNIDERVVQMTFDNKQFEKNVSQSIKTLDDLKKALELDKMNDSLKSLERQTSDVSQSMSALEATVDKVSNVFTPFGNLAYNALNKISNAALEAGENLLKMTLGIEGANLDIKVPGQAKYEAYTKAVQTITNATGKSVKEVSKVLDNLSKYTDETSYDFSEMVTSIGKFTSVGLDLERSERAMEGIANWAAKAGAGKTKANQAMYNISQAMGAGAMKKIDWKSIEIANMATKEFKETAIETAKELGVLQNKGYGVGSILEYTSKGVKETTVDFTNFAETLQTGWLNTEVLMSTLEKYGDTSTEFGLSAYHAAQEALTFSDAIGALQDAVSSGWMLSLKYIFGDLDEARVMWTDFANALIEFADIFSSQRNELLKGWHELGGYNLAVEAASNIWSTFMNIVLGVKEAFEDIFPPTTAENLVEITYQVEQFTEKLNEAFGINTYTKVARKVNDAVSEISTSLREGIRADDVARLQSLLKQTGYLDENFKAYGRYGKKTREAVEQLQKEIGVNVTGAWDEATKAAILSQNVFGDKTIVENLKNIKEVTESVTKEINHASEIWQNLGKGDRNDWVRKLQQELVNAGYDLKKFGVDGIYGPETEAAVKKLQQALGVDVTGAWDDATRAAAEAQKVFSEFNEVEETTIEKTKGLTSPMELIQNTVRIIAGAVKTVIDIISAGLEIGWNVIRMFDPILDLGWKIAHLISQLVIDLTDGIDKGRIIADVTDTILIALSPLAYVIDAVTSPLNSFLDGFQKFLELNKGLANKKGVFFMLVKYLEHNRAFKRNVKNFKLAFKTLKETVKDVFEKIKGVGQNIYDTIFGKNSEKKAKDSRTLITNFLSGIISITTWFSEKLTKIVGTIGDVLAKGLEFVNIYIAPFFKAIRETVIDDKVKSIGEFFTTLWDKLKNTSFGQKLDEIKEKITGFFESFRSTVQEKFPTIYETINNIKDKIAGVFGDFGQVFSYMFGAFKERRIKNITDFFTELEIAIMSTNTGKRLYELYASIKYFFDNLKKNIADKGVIGAIRDALQTLFKWDPNKAFFENITDKFSGLVDTILNIKDKIAEAIRGVFNLLTGKDGETDGNGFTSVFDKIKEFFEKNFANVDWKKIMPIALGGLIGFLTMTAMGKDSKGLTGLVSGLASGKLFKSAGSRILGAAAAIIGAITILSVLPVDEIKEKIEGALEFIRGKLSEFMGKLKDLFTPDENGHVTVLDKIIEAFKKLREFAQPLFDLKDKIVGALKELFGAANGDDTDSKKPTVFDRIKDFVKSLKGIKIGSILGPALGIATIYGIITSSRAFKNLSKGIVQFISGNADLSVKKDTFGDTALKIAGAIAIISLSLGLLSIIDADKVSKNIDSFIKVIAVMAGAMIAVGNLAKEGSNFGVQVLALAGSIAVFAIGLKILADVLGGINGENWGAYLGAGVIIIALLGILGMIEVAVASASGNRSGANISGMLKLCIGVGVLVLAFGHLVNVLETHSVAGSVGAFAIIGSIIAGLGYISIKLAEQSGNEGNIKISGILGMCIGIAAIILAFGHVVTILDDVGAGAIIGSIVALGVIFAGMIILADKLSKAESTWSSVGKNIAQIAAVALAISLVMEAFAKSAVLVKDVDWTTLLVFAAGIAGVIIVVGKVIPILSGLKLDSALKGCLILVAIFTALGASIDIAAQFAADALTSIGSALWLVTDDLAKASSHIGEVDWNALNTFGDYMKNGLPSVLVSASMLKGTADSAHEAMTEISEFGAAFHNYGTQIESITEDTLKSSGYAEQLATSAMSIYTALSGIGSTSGLSKAITDLGAALDIYRIQVSGTGVNAETGEVTDLTTLPKVNAQMISDAFSALAKAIPDDDSIKAINSLKENGENDLTDTALGIEKIGAALKSYSDNIGGLNMFKVMTANAVLNTFKGIYETFQSKDAFLALFEKLGLAKDEQTKVTQFSESIQLVGGALGDYIAATENIDSSKIEIANGIISLIAGIDQRLPEKGGFLTGLLFGNQETLGHFGDNMSHLGSGVKEFADQTAQGDYSHMNDALPAIQTLAEVLGTLDKVGGIASWVSGDKSLAAVTKGLAGEDGVGAQLVDFSGRMKEFKYSDISEAVTAIRSVIGLARQAGDAAYMDQNGRNKIEDIGVGIRRMLNEVASITTDTVDKKTGKSVIDGVAEIGPKLITAIIGGIIPKEGDANPIKDAIVKVIADAYVNILEDNTYAAPYSTIGNNIITAINSGVTNTANTVLYTTLLDIATTGVIKSFSGHNIPYNLIGNNMITAVNTGVVRTAESVLYNTLGNISVNGANEMGDKHDAYIDTGNYLIQGLMIGIRNKADDLLKLARNIGNAAHKALNRATEVKSPSKLFEWTGEMWGEGLTEGIKNSTNDVISSMTGMGESALSSITGMFDDGDISMDNIDGILGGLDGDLDTQINGMLEGLNNFSLDDKMSEIFGVGDGTDLAINNAVQTMFNGFEEKFTTIFQDDGSMTGTIQNMISGIWNGASSSLSSVISEAGDPKQMVLNTIQNAWRGITSDNANFTLKPVLDFENMSIGGSTASNIADYIKGINENNAAMLAANESANQASQIRQEILETYVDVISNKIGVLIDRTEEQTGRINQLGNDMAQMKLVLSTGTLVGEIMPAVDRWLGKKSSIDSRARGG